MADELTAADDLIRCPAGCVNGEDFIRGGVIKAKALGLPIHLLAGGFMETKVIDRRTRSPIRHRDLSSATELEIIWTKCKFLARHLVLGDIHVELDEQRGPSRGTVIPAARRRGGDQPGFYPAHNRNELYFAIRIPRLGAIYRSKAPIVNEAQIDAIPPIGVPYPLARPVAYAPNRRCLPSLEIVSCVVRMMNEERLQLTTEHASVTAGFGRVDVRIDNTSGRSPVQVFWHVKTPDGITARPQEGLLSLGRQPARVRIELDGRGHPGEAEITVSAGIIDPADVPGARGENIRLVF